MSERLHIIPHDHKVKKADRAVLHGHRPAIVWFTGLSGSGKSTLASALEYRLHRAGLRTYILDGDNIRDGLNKGLTFSDADRQENIRRISEVARLFVDAGTIVLTAFISPFKKDREVARKLVGAGEFIEVFVDCPLEVCEQRDVKGLYKKARKGEITRFTGIDSPFEAPEDPEITIPTHLLTLEGAVDRLFSYISKELS